MLIELGRYPEAAELLDANDTRVLPGVRTIHLNATRAHLAIRTGHLDAARHHLEVATAEAGDMSDAQFVIDFYAFGTEIELWDGDPSAALVVALEGFERLAETDDGIILGQLAIPAVHAAADLAMRARAARDRAGADAAVAAVRDVIDRYRASTERLTEQDELAALEIGWRMALCAAELSRAAGEDDPANWEAVRPALSARPAPFLEAYVLWRAAEARAGGGETAAAAGPLREGYEIAAAIGAPLLVAGIESLGRRLRVELAPRDAGTTTDGEVEVEVESPVAPADPFGLSVREREVLALVAEGYTNRRIADTLFISESTAGVHVSHILAKLDVESRTEAAAVAVRLGLDRAGPAAAPTPEPGFAARP